MGPIAVEVFDEVIELGLLLEEVGAGGTGGLLFEGEVHAFMPAVLLGMARFDALDADAQSQPPDRKLERLNKPLGEAKGTPLSERMARGSPRSRKRRSKAVNAGFSAFDSMASQSSSIREA